MKRILVVLLAAALLLCSCGKEGADCIYTITSSVTSTAYAGGSHISTDEIIDQWHSAYNQFIKDHSSDWKFKKWAEEYDYSSCDKAASETYKIYRDELKKLIDQYQEKLDNSGDRDTYFNEVLYIGMERTSTESKNLEFEEFMISLIPRMDYEN